MWHEGTHTCVPKPDLQQVGNNIQSAMFSGAPINFNIRQTTKEFQIDLIGYYVATGQGQKAIEIAQDLADRHLVGKI